MSGVYRMAAKMLSLREATGYDRFLMTAQRRPSDVSERQITNVSTTVERPRTATV